MIANIAGVVTALLAAVPGAIDLFALTPASRTRTTAIQHGSFALLAVGLFAVSAALLWRGWTAAARGGDGPVLDATIPLAFAVCGLLVVVIVGALGWSLVQTHHVGVRPSAGRSDDLDVMPPRTERPAYRH